MNDLKPTCQSQNGQCTNHQADGCRIVQKYLPENSLNLLFDFISNINIFINVKVSFSPSDDSIGASTHVHKLVGTLQPMDEDEETHGPEQHRAEIQQLSTIGTGGSEDSEANESSLGDGCRLVAPVAGSHQNISSQHRNMMLR